MTTTEKSATPATPAPALGRIVLLRIPQHLNNGADECPAMITRVWGESGLVNLIAFPDAGEPRPYTSVRLFAAPEERDADYNDRAVQLPEGAVAHPAASWPVIR